jgi:hypothetical protein
MNKFRDFLSSGKAIDVAIQHIHVAIIDYIRGVLRVEGLRLRDGGLGFIV